MKPSRLAEHLKRKHPDKVNRTKAYFENLKNFDQRNTLPAYLIYKIQSLFVCLSVSLFVCSLWKKN